MKAIMINGKPAVIIEEKEFNSISNALEECLKALDLDDFKGYETFRAMRYLIGVAADLEEKPEW